MNKKILTVHQLDDWNVSDPERVQRVVTTAYVLSQTPVVILQRYTAVEYLFVHPSAEQYVFPWSVFGWHQLRVLIVQGFDVATVWPHLPRLPVLQTLGLCAPGLRQLPYALSECRQLEEIDWLDTRFSEQFEGWHLLEYLPQLKAMHLLRATFSSSVLKGLEDLELKLLTLPKRYAKKFYKEHPQYWEQLWYTYHHSVAERRFCKKLLEYSRMYALDWQQRTLLLNLLANQPEKIDQLTSPERLLAISDLPVVESLRLQAIEYYTTHQQASTALYEGAQLAVVGKLASNKNVLRKQLKNSAITYQNKIIPSTTHVLLGQQSNQAYSSALTSRLPILSEQQVLEYLSHHSGYYLVEEAEEDPAYVDNICQLLWSGREENIELALTLFEQGGFPKQLLTALFYAYHVLVEGAVRAQIGRLLRQYGSSRVVEALSDLPRLYTSDAYPQAIIRSLRQTRQTELDTVKLAQHLYKNKAINLARALGFLEIEQGVILLRTLLQGRCLSLSNKGFSSLPLAVYQLQEVDVLDVSNNQLKNIPLTYLRKMPRLRRLRIVGNKGLLQNNKWKKQLQEQLPRLALEF